MNQIRTFLLITVITIFLICCGYCVGGINGAMTAFIFSMVTNFIALWNSDKIILHMYNAKEVNECSYPEYYQIVCQLAKRAQLPKPKIYVIENPQPNAFATGRNPSNSSVSVTTGLLNILSKEEISAVISHELAHIQNYDTLIMTIIASLAGAISMIGNLSLFLKSSKSIEQNPASIFKKFFCMIFLPCLVFIIKMAISRTQEYIADRRGSEICGNPLWLASALQKISSHINTSSKSDQYNPTTAHIFIINPLKMNFDNFFSTHPSTENRIIALQKISKELNITDIENQKISKQLKMNQRPVWLKKTNKKDNENITL